MKGPLARTSGIVLLALGVLLLGYAVDRSVWWQWGGGYLAAFLGYVLVLGGRPLSMRELVLLAFGLRLALLPAEPLFSDDHFRYLWDGLCSVQGMSPFAHVPLEALDQGLKVPEDLLGLLNSPDRHTTYPPVSQACFAVAAWLGGGDLHGMTVALRALVLLAEGLSLLALFRLLQVSGQPVGRAALYALNPVVIVELVGNLHSEAFVVPFLLFTLLAMHRSAWASAGLAIGLAMAVKLWPLVLLGVFPAFFGWRRAFGAAGVAIGVFTVSWLPWYTPDLVPHVLESLRLYAAHFEFFGGLYEALKVLLPETWVKGGPVMPLLMVLAFSALFLKRAWRSPEEGFLWVVAIYLGFSSTVHPWYIVPLLALVLFTPYRWPYWYAALAVPTYLTYTVLPWEQPYSWVGAAHVLLLLVLALELMVHTRAGALFRARMKTPRLLPLVPAGAPVLDIGTGNGALARLLQEEGRDMTTVDVIDKSLFPEVHPTVIDGRGLPFQYGSFRCVLLITVLHHTRSQEQLLREAARVGEEVVVMEDVYTNRAQLLLTYVFDSLINLEFLDHPRTNRDEAGWERCFAELGLRVVRKDVARTLLVFRQVTYNLRSA